MRGTKLRRAKLVGAVLRHTKLLGADLRGADLRGANVKGVKWADGEGERYGRGSCTIFEDTIMPDGERFTGFACSKDFPKRYTQP